MSTNALPIRDGIIAFINRCKRDDGGYSPSSRPEYAGRSDTANSDLAAVTYAAVLARSLDTALADAPRSAEFIRGHQRPDGSFANAEGAFDPASDLAILYNTTQAVVGLKALQSAPQIDPEPVIKRFFVGDAYKALPWYTTSFFPLFYAAIGRPFPPAYRTALTEHMIAIQAPDGYLGDHVAATFHMAHFFRLIGEETPGGPAVLERVLRDQTAEGGWNIKAEDWDVHACFDAVFILRQLGGGSERSLQAMQRASDWAVRCRNADGGFGHYPGWPSDMDAVYFQSGVLLQAGALCTTELDLPDAHTLGWGQAMLPERVY
jgi:geranylgeranyl transferase type-2 subunit beta